MKILILLLTFFPALALANSRIVFDKENDIAALLTAKTHLLAPVSALSAAKGKQVKVFQVVVDFEEVQSGDFTDCYITMTAWTDEKIVGNPITYVLKQDYEMSCEQAEKNFRNWKFGN